jgi:hypothetical protein
MPQPEIHTSENNFSTFSLNVSDVSFKLAAASLENGQHARRGFDPQRGVHQRFRLPRRGAGAGAPVAFAWERARYPFAHNRDFLRFSLKTAASGRQAGRPLNLVLLLDNSGSMERADRVQIIREALRVLAGQLQAQDRTQRGDVSRGRRGWWLDAVPGDKAGEGSGADCRDCAAGRHEPGRRAAISATTPPPSLPRPAVINRVVLLTDGAANLGDVDPDSLKAQGRGATQQGIALDCFGIGWDGYNDDLLEVLSRNGDGRYGFVNTPEAAATEFARNWPARCKVAASDVKVQVEFNPARVTHVAADRLREASTHQGAIPRQHGGRRRDRRAGGRATRLYVIER